MGIASVVLAAALAGEATEPEARISLDVREADVQDLARVFADVGSFQLVMDPAVSCRLTLKMRSVRWATAFQAMLRSCGLAEQEAGGVVRIATAAKLQDEARQERQLREARDAARSASVFAHRLSYARAAELAPLIKKLLSPRGDVVWDARTNTLLVID